MNLNGICCFQQQKDEYENTEGMPTDGSESTEGLLREELGRHVASRWTGEKTEHQVEEVSPNKNNHGGNSEIPESTGDNDHDNSDGKESSVGNVLNNSRASYVFGISAKRLSD